jgi:AraC-like DNA-binding protein
LVGTLPFVAGKAPGAQFDAAGRTALEDWSDRLASQYISLLDVGSFLLWLIAETRRPVRRQRDEGPAWMIQALAMLDHPDQLAGGAQALVTGSGRSAGCVAKHVRRQFNCTVIQLINRRRLAWLARQLTATNAPIPELAASCGLSNLSHCYKLFRAAYGCPPGEYRERKLTP